MEVTGRSRNTGTVLIAAALLWVVATLVQHAYGLNPPGSGTLFYINQAMFFVAQAGFVTGILGLMREGAAGSGWFGRIALGLFAFGWIALMVATPLAVITGNNDLPLFPLGGLTSMIGGLLAGVAVVVAGRWHGWQRFTILFYALFYFLVLMLPLFVASQEPTLVSEVLWGLAWLPTGYALVTGSQASIPAPKTGSQLTRTGA